MTRQPAGLSCPGCEQPPRYLMDRGTQAFCGTAECHVITWNPTMTLEELADDIGMIDMSGWGG